MYPTEEGFRIPGEFENHTATWTLWPTRPDVWRNKADPAQKVFANLMNSISKFESVYIGVSSDQKDVARSLLSSSINLVEIDYDDVWLRDTGPAYIVNDKSKEVRAVHWGFNSWGGICYADWQKDEMVGAEICNYLGIRYYDAPFIIEGGGIMVNGKGTMIANDQCIVNDNRNPGMTHKDFEEYFEKFLGIKKVIWIRTGAFNDETGGHIDNMCAFSSENTVLFNWTDDTSDPQYELSKDAFNILSSSVTADGKNLEIIKVHQPQPVYITKEESLGVENLEGTLPRAEGTRLPASYINFYIGNKFVALPTFNDFVHDENAIRIFKAAFPDRTILNTYSREILLGGGNIHCALSSQA